MKLRLDLLEQLTEKDLREAAIRSVHRYKPEPLFSKTGVGSLSSASTEERANEVKHSTDLTRKLTRRAQKNWEETRSRAIQLLEVYDFLRSFHRNAPFLFFNGNLLNDWTRANIRSFQ